jgi:hypothetical protein
MKTKLITVVLIIIAVLLVRKNMTTWGMEKVNFGTPSRQVFAIRPDIAHEVLTKTDLGVVQFALVQASRGDKKGAPMWFVQLPFCKWTPVG